MAKSTKINPDALKASIQSFKINWIFDPIDMEHILQIDKGLAQKLTQQRLQAHADVLRVMSDAAAKAAKQFG